MSVGSVYNFGKQENLEDKPSQPHKVRMMFTLLKNCVICEFRRSSMPLVKCVNIYINSPLIIIHKILTNRSKY